jgi:sugar lactone lactonase YvrE
MIEKNTRITKLLADGFTLLEGPRWIGDCLWVSDFFTHSVLRFGPLMDGSYTKVCEVAGQPSGLADDGAGGVMIVSMMDKLLLHWNQNQLLQKADLSNLITGPANDMAMDRSGRAYIGNFGLKNPAGSELIVTDLLRVDPDGSVCVAADDVVFPNGIVFSEDEKTLFVAETYRGQITAFDVNSNGSLGSRRIWANFATSMPPLEIKLATRELALLPDGLTLDKEGCIWVADAKGNGISRIKEGGQRLDYVDTGSLSVYAAALGGPNLTTLYMCCAPAAGTFDPKTEFKSALMVCEVDIPGVPRR